jgi:glyoxylase-like metal-dependent hydrolase (beta-lactamase superfamily II)
MKTWVALFLLAAACGSSSSSSPSPEVPESPAEQPAESTGRAERLQLGALEAFAVEDGHLELPNDGQTLGVGRPAAEIADVLAAAGLPRDTIRLDIQCLLVKAGDRVILFDTGTGGMYPGTGRLTQSLASAGVEPGGVTDIFISHAHGDHIGGLVTKDGALAFPAATIHLSKPEWALLEGSAEDAKLVAAVRPKVDAFEPGAQVLPEVKAIATQGHTPGHSSYEIGTGADKVFYLGDVAHHSVISVQRPAWSIQFDMDRPAAEAMRQETLARLAKDGTRVFAVHFPFPGVGHVAAEGEGLVWKAEAR